MGGVTAWRVAVLPGDGVGPEVTRAAVRALETVAAQEGAVLTLDERPVGWSAVLAEGEPLPRETLDACRRADAVFLGAVGHPDAEGEPRERRPETGLLALRRELGCWANLRPVRVPFALEEASALKPSRVRKTDLLIVRELGGGVYYGEPRGDDGERAWDTMAYSRSEVARVARLALALAGARRGRVTSVDKANVLESSRLWRRVVSEVGAEATGAGSGVTVEHMLVDRAAMELVLNPTRFDVVLTGNLFGDILSDAAAALAGSLGVLGSASLGGSTDLYEPVHGSAPDLAGSGTANPVGALASVALMLRHTFGREAAARRLEEAVDRTLGRGVRTPDLTGGDGSGVGTDSLTDAVIEELSGTPLATASPGGGSR